LYLKFVNIKSNTTAVKPKSLHTSAVEREREKRKKEIRERSTFTPS